MSRALPQWMIKRGITPVSAATRTAEYPSSHKEAGPGTELIKILKELTDGGIPPCQECKDLARKMNHWGPEGCLQRITTIVDDIFPRADKWFAAEAEEGGWIAKLKANAPDFAKRTGIRMYVLRAINAAKKKQTPESV